MEDCDSIWLVVAEGFLVEEQMISSKAGVVDVGGWGCFLHLSRYGPACTRAGAWFLLVGNLWNGKTRVVRWGSLAAAEEDVGVEAVDLAAVVGDVGVGGEVVDHTSGCTGMC